MVIGIVLVLRSRRSPSARWDGCQQVLDDDRLRGVILVGVQRHHVHAGAGALLLERKADAHGRFFGARRHRRRTKRFRTVRGASARSGRCWSCSPSGSRRRRADSHHGAEGVRFRGGRGRAFHHHLQGPFGASLEYTMNIMKQAEAIYVKQPEIARVFRGGFSFSGAASNAGLSSRAKDSRNGERRGNIRSMRRSVGCAADLRHSRRPRHSRCSARDPGDLGVRVHEVLDPTGDITNSADHHAAGSWRRQSLGMCRRTCSRASRPTTRSRWSRLIVTGCAAWACSIREVTDALAVLGWFRNRTSTTST